MKKEPKLSSFIDKAVYDYKMIEAGDRILVGASGGKDSTALIKYFSERAKRPNACFEYKALNIKSEISGGLPDGITSLFEKWEVPVDVVEIEILARLKPGRKMNCYWCSTQRRTELLNYALSDGFNKIALGHHHDDILETLLMNMLNNAQLATMPPRLKYEKYPVEIIRPLCYVSESTLIEYAKREGFFGFTCTCNYQDNSERKKARKLLEDLTGGDRTKKEHIFDSLKKIDPMYLP